MKNIFYLLFLLFSTAAFSQVITEEEFLSMVNDAQENSVGAIASIVLRTNEDFAKSIWGKKVRFNETHIIRFFNHPSGEEASAGVSVSSNNKNNWDYSYDQKSAAGLLKENGIRVTQSFNTLWISANQDLLYAENIHEGQKTILELYCPQQRFLEVLRTGKTQSLEFLITGFRAGVSSDNHLYGILTEVYIEKQVNKCSNGHEFDKALGYNFCPVCGEPLE